jgi:sulfide dehydrogenase cytochrome subunit
MKCAIVLRAGLVLLFMVSVGSVHAQGAAGRNMAAACFTCHGTDGRSVGGVPPALAGRDQVELYTALQQFKAGQRPATIMHQQAKGYTDEQLQRIAAYFSTVKPGPSAELPRAGK